MNAQCSVHSRSVQEVWQRRDSLEDEERSGWPLAVDNDQLRAITKGDPLTTTWEVAKELNTDHYMVIRHLKQIGKVKKLGKWVPHELTKNQKIVVLKCCVLLFYTTMNHFLIGLWRVMKSGFYTTTGQLAMTSWVAELRRGSKALPKAQICMKKRSWSLVVCCRSDPLQLLNPGETITSEK